MKRLMTAGGCAAVALLVPIAAAQVVPEDFGRDEYRANCMVCHGAQGKGDGSYGELLKSSVPDLTTLSKRGNGVFPFKSVIQTIDGRAMPRAHGSSDMPIWGQAYNAKARQYFPGEAGKSEAYVQARILALVEYIYTLQGR
jgi:mono/diheme cytochrome c family protein